MKHFKNYFLLLLMLLPSAHTCFAQKTIDEIESYIFSQVFNGNNQIKEFIEFDEKNDTTRYWQFNGNGKLIKEIDKRESSWSFNANGQTIDTNTTYYKKYYYKYNSLGQNISIDEVINIDEQEDTTLHELIYPDQDTIIEYYKMNDGHIFNLDVKIIKTYEASKPIEILEVVKKYIDSSFYECLYRTAFEYTNDKLLYQKKSYFTINTNIDNEDKSVRDETLGVSTDYIYDKNKRLTAIHEFEFMEDGLSKLRMDVKFSYKGNTNKIKKIDVIYGENLGPKKSKYKIDYRSNGDITCIEVKGKRYFYRVNK